MRREQQNGSRHTEMTEMPIAGRNAGSGYEKSKKNRLQKQGRSVDCEMAALAAGAVFTVRTEILDLVITEIAFVLDPEQEG